MKIKRFIKKNKYDLIFLFFIICSCFGMMIFTRSDSDHFWHLTAGKYMLENHTILSHDIFSWFVNGKYWMSHEWLSEVVIGIFYNIFGKYHVIAFCLSLLVPLMLLIYFVNKDKIHSNKLFALIWFTMMLLLSSFMTARPHLISNLLLGLTIYFLLDYYDNPDSKKIYFLPLITILWANFHGGSSNLPYVFSILFFIISFMDFNYTKIESKEKTIKQRIVFLLIALVFMLCVNINPHGFKMFIYPYINMGNSLMISTISEWRNTSLSDNSHLMYYIFIFFILMIFILSKKKIRFIDLMLFLISIYLGLKSIRFWSYTYIIMSFIVFYYIGARKDDKFTEFIFMGLASLYLLLFIFAFDRIVTNVNKKRINEETINKIKEIKPDRLFNLYGDGGELIYNNIKVFIDGRADLYSDYNYKDYIDISICHSEYEKLISKYKFDYYLVNDSQQIFIYLKNNEHYKPIYKGKDGYYIYKYEK